MAEHSLDQIRHSAAHVLAMAASRLYPEAKIGIGPVTKEGFFYDFEFTEPISWDQIKRIESEMNLIIQENLPFNRIMVPKETAFQILLTRGQVYKAELLKEIPDSEVSFYQTGEEFIDLCRGPHVNSTGDIGAVKITTLTTSHWRNDNTRPKLQRISGVAFRDLEGLRKHLHKEQEIQNRDFRKQAKEMQISLGGSKFVTYTPKGSRIMNAISEIVLENMPSADEVVPPNVRSFPEALAKFDDVVTMKNRSYRELPLTYYSNSRIELSIPLSVIEKDIHTATTIMVRSYLEQESFSSELSQHLDAIVSSLKQMEIKPYATISVPSQTHIGLDLSANALMRAGVSQTQVIDASMPPYKLEITFKTKDEFDREWDLVTLEVGVSKAQYVARSGDFSQPIQITINWVVEKLMAFFLEEYDGGLPYWLSPIQARIIPITDKQHSYARHVQRLLSGENIRVDIDERSETMQSRIRDAEIQKVPLIFIIGEKEATTNAVSIRLRNSEELGLVGESDLFDTLYNLKI